jgi:ApbE superfamily uncharacterized protein (UPF0280 family)
MRDAVLQNGNERALFQDRQVLIGIYLVAQQSSL